jgi:hypothetical protein
MKIGADRYRIAWTYDAKYSGSRLRYPRTLSRDTDRDGAERFAHKWGLTFCP